jgi:hypothetical protein
MGRKRNLVPTTKWCARIPITLAAEVDALLEDPIRPGHVQLSARKQLVTQLLLEYLDRIKKGPEVKLTAMKESELRVKVMEMRDENNSLRKSLLDAKWVVTKVREGSTVSIQTLDAVLRALD